MADEVIPSFNAQLRELTKGRSVARVERLPLEDASTINDTLHRMRRTTNAAVSRIRESTGSNFRVESGAMLTYEGDAVLAVVSVTRN